MYFDFLEQSSSANVSCNRKPCRIAVATCAVLTCWLETRRCLRISSQFCLSWFRRCYPPLTWADNPAGRSHLYFPGLMARNPKTCASLKSIQFGLGSSRFQKSDYFLRNILNFVPFLFKIS